MVSVLNLVLMLVIFPYFFKQNLHLAMPIVAVVVASIVGVLKFLLAFIPFKQQNNEQEEISSSIEKEVSNASKNENDVE